MDSKDWQRDFTSVTAVQGRDEVSSEQQGDEVSSEQQGDEVSSCQQGSGAEKLRQQLMQCALAGLSVFYSLVFLDIVSQSALLAALGATSFIVFTTPSSHAASPRTVAAAYSLGLLVGCSLSYLTTFAIFIETFPNAAMAQIFAAAIAVASTAFLMLVFSVQHPPAAGMALGLVLNDWSGMTLFFVFTSLTFFVCAALFFRPALYDLH